MLNPILELAEFVVDFFLGGLVAPSIGGGGSGWGGGGRTLRDGVIYTHGNQPPNRYPQAAGHPSHRVGTTGGFAGRGYRQY